MNFNRLEYDGPAKGIIVNIIPSRVSIKITPDNPYYFKESDAQDEKAEKYYRSMRDVGVVLIKNNDDSTKINDVKEEPTKEEIVEEVTPESAEPAVKSEPESEPEVVEEKVGESAIPEEVAAEVTEAEMIEFLDLNYSDDEIKNIARDAGVKGIKSTWSKSTVIEKIIAKDPEYVIKLIKNN